MKSRLTVLASALVLACSSMAVAQTTPKPGASPDDGRSPARVPDFQPGLDDLMTLLIQPRHIKLYYAGSGSNWELAAFELAELRAAFRRTAQTIPAYQGNDVSAALQTFIDPNIQAIAAAIEAGNARQFAKAYSDLTQACNSCHTFMEHPFLVMKRPESPSGSAYVDQKFGK